MSEDYGSFDSMANRVVGELEGRLANAKRSLKYNNGFLDDILRGMLPHDLVLLGAPTGMGKTDLALNIATSNATQDKRVAYFALEAEPQELERRTKFALLSHEVHAERSERASDMNYTDWMRGDCEAICGHLNSQVENKMLRQLSGLHTYYRGEKFDQHNLHDEVMKAAVWADLIVVDHLHYIDTDTSESETKGLGDVVKTVRDLSLRIGRPVLLIAHLRKRDGRDKQILATIDDFHGSSNITKICTQAIVIEKARCVKPLKWHQAPTFMTVLKDRRGGITGLVALCHFDVRTKSYSNSYTLGRLVKGGTDWEPLGLMDTAPRWAKHHVDAKPEKV